MANTSEEKSRRESVVPVYGMTCGHCVRRVTEVLEKLEGVEKVQVALSAREAVLSYDPALLKMSDIDRAIEDAGYSVTPGVEDAPEPEAVGAGITGGGVPGGFG